MAVLINRCRFIFYRKLSIVDLYHHILSKTSLPHMMVDLITFADLFYVGRLLVADFIPMTAGFVICQKFCTGMQIYLVYFFII